jgi:hypothetical protein
MNRRWMWSALAAAGVACVGPAMFAQVAKPPTSNDLFSSDERDGGRGGYNGGRDEVMDGGRSGFDSRRGGYDGGRGGFDGGRGGYGGGPGAMMGGVDARWNTPGLAPVERDQEGEKLAQLNGTLGAEIQQLAQKLRDADDEEVAGETEKALNEKVGQQFDVRQQMRERQLAALEAQVERLRNVHNERADQRDRIVRDRVQQLIREAQGLGWGDAGEGGAFKMSWSADSTGNPAFNQSKIVIGKPGKLPGEGGIRYTPAVK